MKAVMNLPHPLSGDKRVDLGRRNLGVAKESLNKPETRSLLEKVGGERVTKEMGVDLLFDSHEPSVPLEDFPHHLAG